ncbi:MAG: alkaline phosphatase D family protein [Chitinophagales bacterium]
MKNLFSFLFSFLIVVSFAQQRSTLKSSQAPFFHGVASGDPLSDKVMIWTKVTPPTGNTDPIDVYWQIATDTAFTNIVNFGRIEATDNTDYTVKVDVCGLQPGTYYYYVFKALGQNSLTGRTKTAPATGGTIAKFGVVSCSSYEHGYFNAYESLSKKDDLDAIIHLGDYIYEYETGGFSSSVVTGFGRTYQPTHEIITLNDYRIRHSHYKLDDQLQMLHQIHPFITTWDDHETANDSYKDGAENHDPATEGPWSVRKVSGTQAYEEYLPIRNPDPTDNLKIWRKLRYGTLLDIIVLDSRLWARDEQDMAATNDPNRNLLGNDQFTWFENQLSDNTTRWKVISQQVMLAPLKIFGLAVNADQWDGYNKDRNRFIDYIESNNLKNNVILTGDIHTTWVNNVPGNSTSTASAEFVVTSVTSPGLDVIETALGQLPQWLLNAFGGSVPAVIKSFNSHMEYVNIEDHGYMILTVTPNKAQGDYVWLDRESIDTTDSYGPSYQTNYNSPGMVQSASAMPSNYAAPRPPFYPIQNLNFALLLDTFEINLTEGQSLNNCLVTVSSPCPNISSSLLSNGNYGNAGVSQFCVNYTPITNFYGEDYATYIFCQTANPSQCDTVVVKFNVQPTPNVDTLFYDISSDSLLQDCIVFNDLVAQPNAVSTGNNTLGTFTFDNNTHCFSYLPATNFNGIHYVSVTACDSLNICDTTVLAFTIHGQSNTTVVELFGDQGELLFDCQDFNDLQGSFSNSGVIYSGTNNVQLFNDSCISYTSNGTFEGTDTVIVYGCDNSNPVICDTTVYWITIQGDSIIDTTAIREIPNTDFAVMGVYPNPFDVELLIQYYLFEKETITLNLYDISGKLISNNTIPTDSKGLKYARLETEKLASGTYLVELKSQKFNYSKKVIKP